MRILGTMMVRLQISPSALNKVLSVAKKKTKLSQVTKEITKEDSILDEKSLMAHFAISRCSPKEAKALLKELKAYSQMITPGGVMQDVRVLVSLPAGQDQANHRDFKDKFLKRAQRKNLKYYSALLALMGSTYLNINAHRKVLIPKGHLLFFITTSFMVVPAMMRSTIGCFLSWIF